MSRRASRGHTDRQREFQSGITVDKPRLAFYFFRDCARSGKHGEPALADHDISDGCNTNALVLRFDFEAALACSRHPLNQPHPVINPLHFRLETAKLFTVPIRTGWTSIIDHYYGFLCVIFKVTDLR